MPDFVNRTTRRRQVNFPVKLFFVVFIVFILYKGTLSLGNTDSYVSPLPPEGVVRNANTTYIFFQKKKDPLELQQIITDLMKNDYSNYSVLVKDFTSDFQVAINDIAVYNAASVNKVPIMAALYLKIDSDEIDPENVITVQQRDIQDYGTGSIRYDPPGSRYTVRTLANLMMKKSDNTAAYVLANRVLNLKTIQGLVNEWGMSGTDMFENSTSNHDQEILFEKIFTGTIADPDLTQEMLSLMIDTDFEDRIPAQLPDNAKVYHKIGTYTGAIHDVGIVVSPTSRYYLGIMIGDTNDEARAKSVMATVSRAVYDFMQ